MNIETRQFIWGILSFYTGGYSLSYQLIKMLSIGYKESIFDFIIILFTSVFVVQGIRLIYKNI